MTLEDHCRLQKAFFEHLRHNGYTCIQQNVCYSRWVDGHHYVGEVDVIGRHPKGFYIIGEMKSTKKKYDKATEQFQRYVISHPEMNVKGVFVSPDCIRRLYSAKLPSLAHQLV